MGYALQIFQIGIILLSLVTLFVTFKKYPALFKRFYLIFIGVFLFEFSTQILWFNRNLYFFTYIGPNINWIITLGWTNIFFFSILIVDKFYKGKESLRFLSHLIFITIISIFAEGLVLWLGIREYAPEVHSILSGIQFPLINVPIEVLYYMPVFMALILGFVGYFENLKINKKNGTM